jgi:hypothetical protein
MAQNKKGIAINGASPYKSSLTETAVLRCVLQNYAPTSSRCSSPTVRKP